MPLIRGLTPLEPPREKGPMFDSGPACHKNLKFSTFGCPEGAPKRSNQRDLGRGVPKRGPRSDPIKINRAPATGPEAIQ